MPTPTAGADNITCSAPTNTDLNALGGDDTITYQSGSGTFLQGGGDNDTIRIEGGSISNLVLLPPDPTNYPGINRYVAIKGNAGSDTIELNNGTIGLNDGSLTEVWGDDGNANAGQDDTITLNGATLYGIIRGDGGQNHITLTSGTIVGTKGGVIGGSLKDIILVNPGAGQSLNVDGNINGMGGDDEITIQGGYVGSVAAQAGNDLITLENGTIGSAGINADSGNDTVRLLGGNLDGNLLGLGGNDDITLDGTIVKWNILAGDGNDTILVSSGQAQLIKGEAGDDNIDLQGGAITSIAGAVTGDDGNDTISLNGALKTASGADFAGELLGGNGVDAISLNAGTAGTVNGGADNDTITLNGSKVASVLGDTGNDVITLTSGTVTATGDAVTGGDGDDAIRLEGAAVAGRILGGNGVDTITLSSGSAGNIDAGADNDTVTLNGSSVSSILGGSGNDAVTLSSGSAGIVDGGADDDTITQTGGSVTSIAGGSGNDDITLQGGVISAADAVTGDDGNDNIKLDGAAITGNLLGGNGADAITLSAGSAGSVDGGADDDTVTLSGSSVTSILGNTGKDTFTLSGGTAGTVDGGADDDTVILSGSSVASITGGSGADSITVSGGTGGTVEGGPEDDTITQTGGSVTSIAGGDGNDDITLQGGAISAADAVTGDDGNDKIKLDGAAITGNLLGGNGADTITLSAGSAGSVDGGADDDTVTLSGSSVTSILGNTGKDTFTLSGGTAGTVDGGADDDTVTLSGSSVTSMLGGTGKDRFTLSGGTATSVDGGADDDTFTLSGAGVGALAGGDGNDTVDWTGGGLISLDGGLGSDTVTVSAAGYDGSQMLDGGDDTTAMDGYVDSLTIAGISVTTNGGKLANWERIDVAGGGLTLDGGTLAVGEASDPASGLFLTGGAHLGADAPLSLTGNLSIDSSSRLEQLVAGSHAITGNVFNSGLMDISGGSNNVLAVSGNYTGGGELLVEVANDESDRLNIGGDVLGDPTLLTVHQASGYSTGKTIDVVTVDGATKLGDFTAGDVMIGAYSYSLVLTGDIWQLVATNLSEATPVDPVISVMLDDFTRETVATHFERTGGWAQARLAGRDEAADGAVTTLAGGARDSYGKVWLRSIGSWADGEGELKGGLDSIGRQQANYSRDSVGLQGGADVIVAETADYLVTAGLFGQTGRITGSARNESADMAARGVDIDVWGLGGSLGFDTASFYAEVVGGWNSYDIETSSRPGSADTDASGWFVSLEAGREFALTSALRLVPQAQFAWIGNSVDSYTDETATFVAYGSSSGSVGRLGVALDADAGYFADQPLRLTGILNYWQEFGDAPAAVVGGEAISLDQAAGSIEAGGGFHWGTGASPMNLHGQLTYRDTLGGDGETSWNGTMGLGIAF